jgi:membrane dipeptidase
MAKIRPIPVFDGHNDTLLELVTKERGKGESFLAGREGGHIDLPRARAGGLAGGMFAMFTPTRGWKKKIRWREEGPRGPRKSKGWDVPLARPVSQPAALAAVLRMTAMAYRLEATSDGALKVVRTHKQLVKAMDGGVLAAVLHIEGAETLTRDLHELPVLYAAGIRSLGPVWSRPNLFGHGVPFNFPDTPDIGPGLTRAGKDLIRLCNELGIVVDLSHLNAKGFWDVAALSTAPLVASHSGAHALSASPRNLTDDQLRAIGESGGIVGVNFGRGFLRQDGLSENETPLDEIARHVEHIAGTIGVEHVGLGSDFDGTVIPQDLGDVAGLPRLLDAMRARGIKGRELERVAHGNWLRVLKKTWRK